MDEKEIRDAQKNYSPCVSSCFAVGVGLQWMSIKRLRPSWCKSKVLAPLLPALLSRPASKVLLKVGDDFIARVKGTGQTNAEQIFSRRPGRWMAKRLKTAPEAAANEKAKTVAKTAAEPSAAAKKSKNSPESVILIARSFAGFFASKLFALAVALFLPPSFALVPSLPLTLLIILPFVGSLLAAVLPANARNTESTFAGIISLACRWKSGNCLFPEIANGQVLRQEIAWLPSLGLDFVVRTGRLCLDVQHAGAGHRHLAVVAARYYMSPDDPVPRFFSFLLGLHGRDAGGGAVGQPAAAGCVLGADQPVLLPADRLLAPPRRCPPRRAHGLDGDRHRRSVLLAGVLLLGHIVGSYDLDASAGSGRLHPQHPLVHPRCWCWCCSAR